MQNCKIWQQIHPTFEKVGFLCWVVYKNFSYNIYLTLLLFDSNSLTARRSHNLVVRKPGVSYFIARKLVVRKGLVGSNPTLRAY
jgi:hypothetical protein